MKILYICHRLPFPPTRGGKIRPFNMIRHLSSNHEVHVVSIARSLDELAEGDGLRQYVTRLEAVVIPQLTAWLQMLSRAPSPTPSSFGYFYSRALKSRISGMIHENNYDLIFVHCSSVAPYVAKIEGPVKILDFGDMDSQKWLDYAVAKPWPLSWVFRLETIKLTAQERSLSARFDLATCTTRAELDTLQSYQTAARTGWFPNGVDHDYFRPRNEAPNTKEICFVGRMDYFPNQQAVVWFCDQVLPALRDKYPQLQLTIVGANPPSKILSLGQRAGVVVTGSVPDVRPYVTRCALSVAPLKIARGTQNKILESMAMGVPVVASELACRGVDAVPGEHVLSATDIPEYTSQIGRLLDDEGQRRRLAVAARARVLSHHDWGRSMAKLDGLIDASMKEAKALRAGDIM